MLIFLMILWIVLNGRITTEIILLGLLISGAIYLFMIKSLNYSVKKEQRLLRLSPLFIKYFFTLLFEIIKSAFIMLKIIITNDKSPGAISRFEVDLQSDFFRTILANSITLTPGTITVKLDGKKYIVHGIDQEHVENITNSLFVKQLKAMEEIYYHD